jgi:hypothetical protein
MPFSYYVIGFKSYSSIFFYILLFLYCLLIPYVRVAGFSKGVGEEEQSSGCESGESTGTYIRIYVYMLLYGVICVICVIIWCYMYYMCYYMYYMYYIRGKYLLYVLNPLYVA